MSEHTINELSALSGLPVRTIRYYLAQGLIPSAGKEGPATRYPDATLGRLRLISRLRDAHLPLAEIRKRLASMTDEAVQALIATPDAPEPAGSALDYVRSLLAGETQQAGPGATAPSMASLLPGSRRPSPLVARRVQADLPSSAAPTAPVDEPSLGRRSSWDHVVITPDIELHVRRPLSRRDNRMVERLIAFARQLQGEDRP